MQNDTNKTPAQCRADEVTKDRDCNTQRGQHAMHHISTEDKPNFNPTSLEFQIGGHRHDDAKPASKDLGVFDIGNATVIKTLQPPPRGSCELNFYKDVFNPECTDPEILELRQFMPSFYGTEQRGDASYLKLANLTSIFTKPCVADIKIGKITYDYKALPEKVRYEEYKMENLQETGFRFVGALIQDNDTKMRYDKKYCRKLTDENIATLGVERFFSILDEDKKRAVVQCVLQRLLHIESWFLKQKKFCFIASSLLFIYEGHNASVPHNCLTSSVKNSSMKDLSQGNNNMPLSQENEITQKEPPALSSEMSMSAIDYFDVNVQKKPSDDYSSSARHGHRSVKANAQSRFDTNEMKKSKLDITTGNSLDDVQEHLGNEEGESSLKNTSEHPLITAHMIDFAHVSSANDIDHNYLFGLQKLISFLKDMVK